MAQDSKLFSLRALATICGLVLAGCDNGHVSLRITDAPIDAAVSVIIEIESVELNSIDEGLKRIRFNPPSRVELLAIPAGQTELLFISEPFPRGNYDFLRLVINAQEGEMDSVIELDDGGVHSLHLSSADAGRLTITQSFRVPRTRDLNLTLDFNLRRSIEPPAVTDGDYVLRPTLRLVNDEEAGVITGSVDQSRIVTDCEPAVYVFTGLNAVPDDLDTAPADDPITSAFVQLDNTTGIHNYTTAPLVAGDYTVAFTCEADLDDPRVDDVIDFPVTENAQVVAEETVTVDIPG